MLSKHHPVLILMFAIIANTLCLAEESTAFSGTVNYGINITPNKEAVLFPFDNYSVPFRSGLQLDLVEGTKSAGPVLALGEAGRPDSNLISYYGTVLRVGDELRMWYECGGNLDKGPTISWLRTAKIRLCYAVSLDGIHWTKPNLGLVTYNGNNQNNLAAFEPRSGSFWGALVLHEPDDPDPAKRFKLAYEDVPSGAFCVAYSADGLSWKNSPSNPVMQYTEPSGLIKTNGLYYVLGQNAGFMKRVLGVHASPDFEHWTEANVIGFRRDNVGPLHPQIYGDPTGEQVHLGAALWDRGNVILGLYGQWHGAGPEREDRRHVTIDLGLIVSHDAMHYQEPIPDFKFVSAYNELYPNPLLGFRLAQGQGFDNLGDKSLIWYSLWGPGGGGDGIHLAQWERDRFGYLAVALSRFVPGSNVFKWSLGAEGQAPSLHVPPHFITCPIQANVAGNQIFVNVEGLGQYSQITVELLDTNFRKIPEFSGEFSIPLQQSGFYQPVVWRNQKSLPQFDKPFRIQVTYGGIRPEDAKVFAVYVK